MANRTTTGAATNGEDDGSNQQSSPSTTADSQSLSTQIHDTTNDNSNTTTDIQPFANGAYGGNLFTFEASDNSFRPGHVFETREEQRARLMGMNAGTVAPSHTGSQTTGSGVPTRSGPPVPNRGVAPVTLSPANLADYDRAKRSLRALENILNRTTQDEVVAVIATKLEEAEREMLPYS